MQFTSITEYFYKVFSRLLFISLVPIFVFTFAYLQPAESPMTVAQFSTQLKVSGGIVIAIWILSFLFFNKKIKSIRNDQGLRKKLEKYFRLTIVRYIIFSLCSLMLAIAFLLTRNDLFAWIFIFQLIVSAIVWPFSQKVSNDLKLKGAEREMVYYRKDTLN